MVDEYFATNFRRLTELKRELAETTKVYQKTKEQLESLTARYGSLERLMTAEIFAIGDKSLEKQLQDILQDKPTVVSSPINEKELTKFDFLVGVLFHESLSGKGVTPKELLDLARKKDPDRGITTMNANDTLSKLKKRGLVEQRDRRYYLTENGRNYWNTLSN